MRTKALLCAAALAAGACSTWAQSNVYSLNVVGYVNVSLTNKFNLIANQLDLDGNMTNNTLYTTLGTNLPNLTKVYSYDSGTGLYGISTFFASSSTWSGATAGAQVGLTPGNGVFVQIPGTSGTPTPLNATLVGNVIQGTHNLSVPAAFQINSIIPPLSTGIQTGMGYVPGNLDKVYQFAPATQLYNIHTYFSSSSSWVGGEPTPAVGEAFFLKAASAKTWTQTFNVQ